MRLTTVPAPNDEENSDYAAEKDSQDSLARLENMVKTAKETANI